MSLIRESATSVFTPQMVEKLAGLLGAETEHVGKTAALVGPLLIAALGRKAVDPAGAGAISGLFDMVPAEVAADQELLLDRLTLSNLGARVVDGLLGDRAGGVATSLSRFAGVPEIGRVLEVALPLGLVQVAKAAEERGLDAGGLTAAVKDEAAGLAASADEAARAVLGALADADAQKELEAKIGQEAWAAVSKAPLIAAGYVSEAGKTSILGDPLGSAKEMEALVRAFDPTAIPSGSVLVDGVVTAVQEWLSQSGGERPWDLGVDAHDRRRVEAAVSAKLKSAVQALAGLPADELSRYKQLIVDAATKVAEAGKEGGILGIGGKRVSDDEAHALWVVETALGL